MAGSTVHVLIQTSPGKQNGDADGLSRRPHGKLADDLKSQKERERIRQFTQGHLSDPENIDAVDQAVVQAICERQLIYSVSYDGQDSSDGVALVETLAISATAVPDSYVQEDHLGGLPVILHLTEAELANKQRADQSIKHVISQIEQGENPPPTLRHELTELPLLLRELNRLELRNNILYRRRQVGSQTFYQLVLPAELRDTVLTSLHNHMGHMGVDRTLDLVRTRFFWPKMALDVERKVKTCGRCVRRKALPERAAPLVNINTTRPLELLCMDSYKIAIENAAKIAHKNKMRYDRRVTASDLEAGDRVLVRNVRIRGKHKISDKWESIVHVVVRRAGTLPVYTVKPENQDGPLRTLHRDLLLPCGYLPTEVNKAPDQQPARCRPATSANPTVYENHFSDDEDEIIPVYCFREPPNAQFPTVHDSLMQPDPTMSTVQDKQHTEPPSNCPVESPVNAQNVDCTPEINKPPDMSNGASDSLLTINDPNCHHYDTEDLLTERVMLDEQVDEIVMTESNLPASKNPVEEQNLPDDDIQIEQLPVFSEMLESEKEMSRNGSKEPEEEIKDITVRRSERNLSRQRDLTILNLETPLSQLLNHSLRG